MNITESIKYIGVNDHDIDLFEGQYEVPNGVSYNSYLVLDEQTMVIDTVDRTKTNEWLDNIRRELGDKAPDYLLVQHMEPDHSASIEAFRMVYPGTVIVANNQIIEMIGNFFPGMETGRIKVVDNMETMSTGRHSFTFVFAPMVHWPEVMMTYEASEKILFSADGFGKFGALDADEPWTEEARRYYIGIVGKYGDFVQAVLQAAAGLDIEKICPLHGPVLTENLGMYLDLYDKWSGYKPEKDGICICYTSVYGQTKVAAETLKEMLIKYGAPEIEIYDLARCDMHKAIAAAFKYNKLVLATTTYNGEIYPFMDTYLNNLVERKFQNRSVALIENGSWAPQAAACMKRKLAGQKGIKYIGNTVTIKSAVKDENLEALNSLAQELTREYRSAGIAPGTITPEALFNLGYGLYVVTSNDGNKDNGLIVNTVSQINGADAPLLAVSINKNNYSAQVIARTRTLNISVLDESAPFEIFRHFGFRSGRDADKFPVCAETACAADRVETYAAEYMRKIGLAGTECAPGGNAPEFVRVSNEIIARRSSNGLYYLTAHTNAYISAEVVTNLDLETHTLFICRVTESAGLSGEKTMTYDYYHSNVKPKPAKAPSKGLVCKICGYVYEGTEIPDDYVCPICKHGPEAFE